VVRGAYEAAVRESLTGESCGFWCFEEAWKQGESRWSVSETLFLGAVEGVLLLNGTMLDSQRSVVVSDTQALGSIRIDEGQVGHVSDNVTQQELKDYVETLMLKLGTEDPEDLLQHVHDGGPDLAAEFIHLVIDLVSEVQVENAARDFSFTKVLGIDQDDDQEKWN